MEKNYLLPEDGVKPLEIGNGYRDYLLSELLRDVVSSGISVVLSSVGVPGLGDCYEWDAVISFFPKEGWESNMMFNVMIMGDSYYVRPPEEKEKVLSDLIIRIYENNVDDVRMNDLPQKHSVRKITFVRVIH